MVTGLLLSRLLMLTVTNNKTNMMKKTTN